MKNIELEGERRIYNMEHEDKKSTLIDRTLQKQRYAFSDQKNEQLYERECMTK